MKIILKRLYYLVPYNVRKTECVQRVRRFINPTPEELLERTVENQEKGLVDQREVIVEIGEEPLKKEKYSDLYYSNVKNARIVRYLTKPEIEDRLSKPEHFTNILQIPEVAPLFSTMSSSFIVKNRFDLIVKYIYANNYIKNRDTKFPEELYLSHIEVFNNYKEPDGSKTSKEDFILNFHLIIDSIINYGFNANKSILPVGKQGSFIEGSHRLGTALALNQSVPFVRFDFQDFCFDYEYFSSRGLHQTYMDYIAHNYVLLDDNLRMCILFPAAEGKNEEVISILNEYADVYFKKEIIFNDNAKELLFAQIYWGENWIGCFEDGFETTKGKSGACFNGDSKLRVILINPKKDANMIEAKERIRELYYVGKHSVHINDTYRETYCLSGVFFNQNSIDFLNENKYVYQPNYVRGFIEYQKKLEQLPIDERENYCLSSSVIISAYGLRDCRDIDYISTADYLKKTVDISNHSSQEKYYGTTFDNIIWNPKNHFYFLGYKFASAKVIYGMKKIRNEKPKDIEDMKLLDKVIKAEKKIYCVSCVRNEEYYLSGFFEHIREYVDGFVFLDDGSTDKTLEILKNEKKMLDIIYNERRDGEEYYEGINRRKVVLRARELGADWILCIDPDERFATNFLQDLRKLVNDAELNHKKVYAVNFRELWDEIDYYRSDGIWNEKVKNIFFRAMDKMTINTGQYHTPWHPAEYDTNRENFVRTSYNLYHLRMIKEVDRIARKERYNRLDPEKEFQPIGYDYLCDNKNLELTKTSEMDNYNQKLIPKDLRSHKYS